VKRTPLYAARLSPSKPAQPDEYLSELEFWGLLSEYLYDNVTRPKMAFSIIP
jgi:hypothetical protein